MFKTRSRIRRPLLVAVRVTAEEYQLLQDIADRKDLTMSQVLRRTIRQSLGLESPASSTSTAAEAMPAVRAVR